MPGDGFFAVDRRLWALACEQGLNAAVAYLVLGRGTGRDQQTTSWSTNATEKYTGISRFRAKAAVESLIGAGLVNVIEAPTRPRYQLVAWDDRPESDVRPEPDGYMRLALDKVARGKMVTKDLLSAAKRAVMSGWLVELPNGGGFALAEKPKAGPEYIWLPNTLVTGTTAGEPSPVERVRQNQDVMALRLLVDLYRDQHLVDDAGISRRVTRGKHDRTKVGESGELTVWGFRRTRMEYVSWDTETTKDHRREPTKEEKAAGENPGVDFFRRTALLARLGLIEWVPHIFESDDADSEVIFPIEMGDSDSPEEIA